MAGYQSVRGPCCFHFTLKMVTMQPRKPQPIILNTSRYPISKMQNIFLHRQEIKKVKVKVVPVLFFLN